VTIHSAHISQKYNALNENICLICKYLIVLSWFVVFSQGTSAQIKEPGIRQYTIEDGLSLSHINCLYKDRYGFIWIGTQDGLNKFDGYSFTIYRHEPEDTSSISSNNIQGIHEDADGNIWVSTQYGLNKLNQYTGKFEMFISTPDAKNSIMENTLYALLVDENSVVWSKSLNGLIKYNQKNGEFSYFEHYFDRFNFLTSYNMMDIEADENGILWVASKDGLFSFDKNSEQWTRYRPDYEKNNDDKINQIRCILVDGNFVYAGTNDALLILNKTSKTIKRIEYKGNDKDLNLKNTINAIAKSNDGNIWLGTDKGIYQLALDLSSFTDPLVSTFESEYIRNVRISSLHIDESDFVWIGTKENSMLKVDLKPTKFNIITNSNENTPILSSLQVWSVFVDLQKYLYVGTSEKGLDIIDMTTLQKQNYNTTTPVKLAGNFVQSIFKDKNQNIWVGTNSGINVFRANGLALKDVSKEIGFTSDVRFLQNRVYEIAQDDSGYVWFATQFGLHYFDGKNINSLYHRIDAANCLSDNEVFCILPTDDGRFWAGTVNGLTIISADKKTFTKYFKSYKNNKGISNNSVLSLHQSANGDIWIGTESGLNKFDKQAGHFDYITQRDGMRNDYIYAILEDKNNTLWMSTNLGVVSYNTRDSSIVNYDLSDGLQGYEFNLGADFADNNGIIFFGGNKGINFFSPENMNKNTNVFPINITGIKIYNKNGSFDLNTWNKNEFVISYLDYSVTISFAIPEYSAPEQNLYKVMLEGVDQEWILLKNSNSMTYTHLAPGDYTFRVMGANSDGTWYNSETVIKIKVKPGFFNSKLAFFVYLILGLAFMYALFMYITRQLRYDNLELKERERISMKIAEQKEELTIKNKNILDSMMYARHIINAMMPTEDEFKSILPNSFIFHRPKDIVSGDFYWITKQNNKIFLAAADCTGHGIPGAFMSIIGYDLLRNIIIHQKIEDPGKILGSLSTGIVATFSKDTSEKMLNDGMDIAFCTIDTTNNTLQYAGAYNPIYLLRDDNILEFKGDRFSVGASGIIAGHNFTTHSINLQPNDTLYLFSDGIIDQFGGPEGKKYKSRRFRHLLLNIHQYHPDSQQDAIERAIDNWMGIHEQVDDILVIGVKPNFE